MKKKVKQTDQIQRIHKYFMEPTKIGDTWIMFTRFKRAFKDIECKDYGKCYGEAEKALDIYFGTNKG